MIRLLDYLSRGYGDPGVDRKRIGHRAGRHQPQLSTDRSQTPRPLIDQYLVNTPHERLDRLWIKAGLLSALLGQR